MKLLALGLQLGDEVEPEGGGGGQALADRVVERPLGAIELRVGRRRAAEADVLAEVERHAASAGERPAPIQTISPLVVS